MRISIIIVLFLSTSLFGQNDSTKKRKWYEKEHPLLGWLIPDSTINSKLCVKIAPLSNLGIYAGPSFRAGIEYKIKDKISFYNEFGWFYLYGQGGLTKFEIKKYLNNSDLNVGNYLSVELFYKYQQYNATDTISFLNSSNTITKYSKDYFVSKNVECLTIKYGSMTVYKFGIVVDLFVGLGIRLKQANNTLTTTENNNIQHSSDYGPNVFTNEAGIKVYPNLDAGIKIGFNFKRQGKN